LENPAKEETWKRRKWWRLLLAVLCPLFVLAQLLEARHVSDIEAAFTASFRDTVEAAAAVPLLLQLEPEPPDEPLNIVVLYPDDWRHDSMHMAGNQQVHTPFLDELAAKGVRFSQNCVTTSVCWISRATLWTGQYASRHGAWFLYKTGFYNTWNQTYPGLLRDNGYHVGHIGKWQYKDSGKVTGTHYDFARIYEGQHWYKRNGTKVHGSTLARNDAIDFLRERPKDKPFVLNVAFYPPKPVGRNWKTTFQPTGESANLYRDVHIPEPYNMTASWEALPREIFVEGEEARNRFHWRLDTAEKFQTVMRNYYACITDVDKASRGIWEELERQDLLKNTLVIFTTDNGMFHGEHGLSGKWYPYQESIRVPLIVWDPRIPAAKRGIIDPSFTLNVDLAPTILSAAGIKVPSRMQGRDLSDLYLERRDVNNATVVEPWREEFFYEHHQHGNIRKSTALVRHDFKYMEFPVQNVTQLFDLRDDPLELRNLANSSTPNNYTQLVDEMKQRHDELKGSVL
jgi:arylsulfatase A-like enzyme